MVSIHPDTYIVQASEATSTWYATKDDRAVCRRESGRNDEEGGS